MTIDFWYGYLAGIHSAKALVKREGHDELVQKLQALVAATLEVVKKLPASGEVEGR